MRKLPLPLLLVLLTACEVGPNYKRPQVEPAAQFRTQAQAEAASFADQPWWDVFADPTLKGLIDQALANNFDAREAVQRVAEFRARAGIEQSDYLPQVDLGSQALRGRSSSFAPSGGKTGNQLSAQATLSWELDLWGRLRRLNEASRAQFLASQEAQRGVFLTTAAQVAQAYFQLRDLDARLEIARSTTQAFQETYDLFNHRFTGGAASALETSRAEAAQAAAAAYIPDLERQIQAQENLLSFLVGRNPGPIPRGAVLTAQPLPPQIPAGLPSTLMERRPDLRQAEQELVSANAQVGVAQANYFPTLSLTGLLGGLAPNVNQMFSTGREWNIGPSFNLPPLQGLRLKYQKAAAVAQWEQARTRYQAAVSGAFGEVSTQLTAYQKLAEVETQQARAVAAYQEAVRLATLRYTAGLSSYMEVLEAQQQLFPAQNSLSQARLSRLVSLVQLYKALGGGWNLKNPEDPGAWAAPRK
ncbi:MAG: efflux transporter outer membrane subunit [Holophaga sp.]|nr:efflux transporter outer membrane subunit [Holophaga sp.]